MSVIEYARTQQRTDGSDGVGRTSTQLTQADLIRLRQSISYQSQEEARPANRVLAGLPFDTWQRISPHLERCLIFSGQVLHEANGASARFYFPNSGLISIVQKTGNSQLEVAMAGRETFIGALCLLQTEGVSPLRAVAQTPGTAFWLPQSVLRQEWERDSRIRQLVLNHANWLMRQTAQAALCSCAHNVEERLSRWLLSARDRLDSEEICVTHQVIAQMLGVRRSGVTMTLRAFQHQKLLRTARGRILLENRDGLEKLACSCRVSLQLTYQELSTG